MQTIARKERRMTDRSKFIVLITTLAIVLIASVCGRQETLVTAAAEGVSNASSNAVGPSQFYAQHNIISDESGVADHQDANLVNAWGLDAGPNALVDCRQRQGQGNALQHQYRSHFVLYGSRSGRRARKSDRSGL